MPVWLETQVEQIHGEGGGASLPYKALLHNEIQQVGTFDTDKAGWDLEGMASLLWRGWRWADQLLYM